MSRWRRLARKGSNLLACAVGGTTFHAEELWSEPRFLAIHPLYNITVTPGSEYSYLEVAEDATMEVDFVPVAPPTEVRLVGRDKSPYGSTVADFEYAEMSVTFSCEVVEKGTWFRYASMAPGRFYRGDVYYPDGISGLDGCGAIDRSFYGTPEYGEAGVKVRYTTSYSEVTWPSGAHQNGRTDTGEVIVRISATMQGCWVWLNAMPSGDAAWGTVKNDWKNGGVAKFPGTIITGKTDDVVTYEDKDDEDFPVGVDYRKTA